VLKHKKLIVLGLAALFILVTVVLSLYTTLCWFDSLGYSSVFWKMTMARIGCALVFGGGFFAIVGLNLYLARRFGARTREFTLQVDPERPPVPVSAVAAQVLLVVALALPSIASVLIALVRWPVVLKFFYGQPFDLSDPIFGRDLGFYVFSLPFSLYIRNWLFAALGFSTVLTAWFYRHAGMIEVPEAERPWTALPNTTFAAKVKTHLAVLAGLLLLNVAWGYRLKMFKLLYSRRGVAYGASYADVNAQLVGYWVLLFAATIFGIILFTAIWQRNLKLPLLGLAATVGLWVVFLQLVPRVVTQLIVKPNEISTEREFIKYNIKFTRQAYGLDNIAERPFPAELGLDAAAIARNAQTIDNIRLWDARPLKQTHRQRQELRPYYEFQNVDVDRYQIDGKYRQVMLSAREMSSDQLPSKTWVNKCLKFTHGYGAVMNPVNEVTSEGMPDLYIRDIPPESEIDLDIERPEIYYGEVTREYVIVKTKEEEFDYPHKETNKYATYGGRGGVGIGSFVRKLAFAWRFMAPNIIFTGYITPDSRVMLYRQIAKRARAVAPFLLYDKDPYLVISGGKLYWILDAYSTTTMYPYSEPYTQKDERGMERVILNYMRNSVKVLIDAYDGTTTFYVIDSEDPVVRAYMGMFPTLFTPFEKMSEDLKKHIRYPQDMFSIQASMYNRYHMRDPEVFYNQEDLWTSPTENYEGREQKMLPYYVIMRLAEEEKAEFLLLLPATPSNKKNMIALLIARSDAPHYGELNVSMFSKDKLIYGPMQVEARIDQEPTISEKLTLWGQMGSKVIRGNLLVIPVEKSLLYVEPVYLQATEGELPQLKSVIVAYGEKIAMDDDLTAALASVFGDAPAAAAVAAAPRPGEVEEKPKETPSTASIAELVRSALKHYEGAMEQLKSENWAGYGEQLGAVKKDLKKLEEATKEK